MLSTNLRMKKIFFILFWLILAVSCSEHTPLPMGYNRIDKQEYPYILLDAIYYGFEYASIAHIETASIQNEGEEEGFNIVYPAYNARIYCSYTPISPTIFAKTLEDNHRFVFSHVVKADGIRQTLYENPERKTSGIIYDIEGNVATPIQFFLTDSVRYFFRGSLYYDTQVKADSVSPVTAYIREDILRIIESFEWKNKKGKEK